VSHAGIVHPAVSAIVLSSPADPAAE